MLTLPAAEDTPELTPNCPEVAAKSTVTPETGSLAASTTVAVIIAEFEPSAFTEVADEERIIDAADAAGDAVLVGVPPPLRQPANPKSSNIVAANLENLVMYMAVPIRR